VTLERYIADVVHRTGMIGLLGLVIPDPNITKALAIAMGSMGITMTYLGVFFVDL
jgi:hypothetical protein